MDAEQTQLTDQGSPTIAQERRPGDPRPGILRRLRSALLREPRKPEPTIVQVMAEWAEYQMIFNDILTRLSAQLARQAKMEKKRLERISDAVPDAIPPPVPAMTPKAALRSQYAAQRYGARIDALLAQKERQENERTGTNGSG